ncbi:hypothetical protein M422DRAFT_269707 [Sphaerobolus stellatus SS14]|uniref:Uncharacterized protein n=1 Tax=Sphaerobolus stellatus (strain SS14) TaxID=990650 RepID=A0A0C9THI1_SPHS4|nr:hypothetical protein M422DRAFT_269707 [Sphaerobolus stellatus SS14]
MAYFMKWRINNSLIQATSLQTGVTAILHTFLAITLGILLSITGSIAIDRIMRHLPTLSVLHLHMNAWARLLSSFRSSWNFFRASSPEIDSHGLRCIFFYLGACTLLQISSSSIFVLNLNVEEPSTTLLDYFSPFILQGSRFGDFDKLWPSGIKITSSDREVFPPVAENARRTMFAGRVNDTRYPGLQGGLIHDTINLNNGVTQMVPWSQARVNGTLMNVHCSQISDAHISTFTLPYPSSDLSLAKPSPDGCLFQNTTDDEGVWLNFSTPAPPYWDPSAPGLNFTAYWGSNEDVALPIDRQFLLAFTPSTFYNDTSGRNPAVGDPERILGDMLDGNLIGPQIDADKSQSALVNVQGSLERLFPSYLWNINCLHHESGQTL